MSRKKFQKVTGMYDILPQDWPYYEKILDVVKEISEFYGFRRIETPILEKAELFEKGTGSSTDIVEKEMYAFRTKGEDLVALRPEGTPSVCRAYIEHGMSSLTQPVKLWSFGPYFRHEKPQSKRNRQFWQFNLDIIGGANSALDAQVMKVVYEIFKELKLKDIIFEINSIGDSCCRPYYKKVLGSYLRKNKSILPVKCQKKLKMNPLRVLDCKEEKVQTVIQQAPQIVDHLCKECKNHFKEVLEFLDELDVPYDFSPYLVRGLDYYTRTVFEVFSEKERKRIARNALTGGGRYDHLIKLLGGKDIPACGVAGGVERIIDLMKEKGIKVVGREEPKLFLAQLGKDAKKRSSLLIEEFRKARVPLNVYLGRDSLKAQLKIANKLKVKYTLILGQKEVLEKKIIMRDMKTGKQKLVKLEKVVKEVKKLLRNKK